MGDVEQLREHIKGVADQNLPDKLSAVAVDGRTADQLKVLVAHPDLPAKLDELAATVQQGVADLAETVRQARFAMQAQREAEAAERARAAAIEAAAIRQAVAIRAQELEATDVAGPAAGPRETTDR